ncbi:MAG: flagellar biosynthetic protein FliR [Pseudomonadota bacterium]
MIEILAALTGLLEDRLWEFAKVFIRVSAVMAVLPAFGEQSVPIRVKLGAALAFALIVTPAISEGTVTPTAPLPAMLGSEVVVGLILGLLFRFFVFALQIAGSVAANVMSLSQLFGGGLGAEPQPAFSTLLVVAGLALATMLGLHVYVVQALILSYELFPPGRFPNGADISDWGIDQVARSFALGLSLAGPFVLASILYNLGLGVISRAMPQLMVAFVGAPAISMGGLVLLLIVSPFLLSLWVDLMLDGVDLRDGAFQ